MFEADQPIPGHLRRNGTYVRGHAGRRRRKSEAAPAPVSNDDLLTFRPPPQDMPMAVARPSAPEPLAEADSLDLRRRALLDKLLRRHGGPEVLRAQAADKPREVVERLLAGMVNLTGCTRAQVCAAIGLQEDGSVPVPAQE